MTAMDISTSLLLILLATLGFWQGFRIFQLEKAVGIRDEDGKRTRPAATPSRTETDQ